MVGEVGPPAVGGEAPKPEPLLEPNPDPEFGPLFEPKPVPLLEPKPLPDAPFAPVLFDAPLRLVAAPAVASRALWLRSKTNSHWL